MWKVQQQLTKKLIEQSWGNNEPAHLRICITFGTETTSKVRVQQIQCWYSLIE